MLEALTAQVHRQTHFSRLGWRLAPSAFVAALLALLVACEDVATVTEQGSPPDGVYTPVSGPRVTAAPAGRWQSYGIADGLPSPSVSAVAADPGGGVWVGTTRGVAHFDGERWTSFLAGNGPISSVVLSVAVAPTGVAWIGTDRGISRFDGQEWTSYDESDGIPAGFVQVAEADGQGRIWFGFTGAGDDWAFGNGAARIDDAGTLEKDDDEWVLYPPTRERMAGDIVSAIVELGEHGVWFGTTPEGTVRADGSGGGVWRLDSLPGTSEGEWTVARISEGLPNNIVTALTRSAAGGLWLGTTDGLIELTAQDAAGFDFSAARRFSVDDGLPSARILALATGGDGRIWVGTDAGLATVLDDRVEAVAELKGLLDDSVRDIAIAEDGAVWVATPSGVGVLR